MIASAARTSENGRSWYQEDGNIQVFRLFKDEQNVRSGTGKDGSPGRIEAFSKSLTVAPETWRRWEGTYTVAKPVGACIFQLMHEGSLWPFHIEMSDKGDISFLRRRPTLTWSRESQWLKTWWANPSVSRFGRTGRITRSIRRRPLDGGIWKLVTKGSYTKAKDNKVSFRWGMYCGSKKGQAVRNDAMLFVTGVTPDAVKSIARAGVPPTTK